VTVTAAVFAYGTATTAEPPIYLAPLVMNVLAIIIIFDKAVSIQRKVGYLQLMEEHLDKYVWMWERQLDDFRKEVPERPRVPGDPSRKHSYVTTVGLMLLILNAISFFLFIATPSAWKWHIQNFPWLSLLTSIMVLAIFICGIIVFLLKRSQLINGRHSGPQIRKIWERVLERWKLPLNMSEQPKGQLTIHST